MADEKISELPAGTALDGTELFPVDQAGNTVSVTGDQINTFVQSLIPPGSANGFTASIPPSGGNWNATPVDSGANIQITGHNDAANGGNASVVAGNGTGGGGVGGDAKVQAGTGNGGFGGDASLIAGTDNVGGGGDAHVTGGSSTGADGGAVDIFGGASTAGSGGGITIRGGSGDVGGFVTIEANDGASIGGQLLLKAGTSNGGNGGELIIRAGSSTSGGNGGNVEIDAGSGAGGDGFLLLGTTVAIPAADPMVTGAVWDDGTGLKLSGDTPGTGGGILNAQITVTSAEILDLFNTPIQVIPAPGAGKLIIVDYAFYNGTGAYTQAAGAGLQYGATGDWADNPNAPQNPFINGVFVTSNARPDSGSNNMTADVNQPIMFVALSTNPTVGTTPITLTVQYRIITL